MIYTIGYEGLSIGDFLDILQAHAIDILIDVRELPLSRKQGFSKNSLSRNVCDFDIQYIHMRELGAPREIRHRLRATNNWVEYCSSYQNVLENQKETLKNLSVLSENHRVCLMCFEEDYRTCHRSLITEKMTSAGLIKKVNHLNPKRERAALTKLAV